MAPSTLFSFSLLTLLCLLTSGALSTKFTIVNKCDYTVWPGLTSNNGPQFSTTGFTLEKGETKTLTAPASWRGRLWGRTHCSTNFTGGFSCVTGDCGSGKIECSGNGPIPPATLAEFSLKSSLGLDFYDFSLVDGYNLPMLVVPQGGSGNCTSTGCVMDVNGVCPPELQVTTGNDDGSSASDGVACTNACVAFKKSLYCCTGPYSTPDTCKPTMYSKIFKDACPHAYSYQFDDSTSSFSCANATYTIIFCASPKTSQKGETNNSPEINSTMVYEFEGAGDGSYVWPSSTTTVHVLTSHVIAAAVSIMVAVVKPRPRSDPETEAGSHDLKTNHAS